MGGMCHYSFFNKGSKDVEREREEEEEDIGLRSIPGKCRLQL